MKNRFFEHREDIERIEGAEYWSSDGFAHWAHDTSGAIICRFTFGNFNTSSADYRKAAGIEVYRNGFGYFGEKKELTPAFEFGGDTYYHA